jgi:hypothetical protein
VVEKLRFIKRQRYKTINSHPYMSTLTRQTNKNLKYNNELTNKI